MLEFVIPDLDIVSRCTVTVVMLGDGVNYVESERCAVLKIIVIACKAQCLKASQTPLAYGRKCCGKQ
jgi:hypothetical protein